VATKRSTAKQSSAPVVVDGVIQVPPEVRRRFQRLAWIYLIVAAGLVPWIVYLAITLPRRNLEHHYRTTWVGFDILLVVALASAAYLAFRMDARVQFPATTAATLLVVDAWFDITTSANRSSTADALLLAVFLELPAAAFSLYVARRVSHRVIELARLELANGGHPPPDDPDPLNP
jgi:hypothetical protein